MGPTCKLIESSRWTSTLVRAQETAAADAWPGKAVAICQQGPSCPTDPRQSPKGNWIAFKAGLIKNDFAAPAEKWAGREKLSCCIEESKMECHIKPSLKKNKHKNKKRKLVFDVMRQFV